MPALPDVSVLLNAHRPDAELHAPCAAWLRGALREGEPLVLSDLVLAGFIRVATHPRIFNPPTPLKVAFKFLEDIREQAVWSPADPQRDPWTSFRRFCQEAEARGNLVTDAYLAAQAERLGCEVITTDRDFAKFPGLRWRTPA